MTSGGRSVHYYSAFRLPFEDESTVTVSLQRFSAAVRVQLGAECVEELRQQFELLNVPEAAEAVETLSRIWLGVRRRLGQVSLEDFEEELVRELQLGGVWDLSIPSCASVHKLLEGLLMTLDSMPSTDYPELSASSETEIQLTPLASLQESAGKNVAQLDSLPGELSTCANLRKWLTRCCDSAKSKFLVTREFVTQTADVARRNDQTLLRLIQPSQQFYKAAIDAWVKLGDAATPSKFVEELKRVLGAAWTEGLLKPCLFFFKVARNEWEMWQEDPSICFAARVNAALKRTWTSSIIDSCRLLIAKKPSP